MIDELRIREIVREELNLIMRARQDNCLHARSGTFMKDGTMSCDDCFKILTDEDY